METKLWFPSVKPPSINRHLVQMFPVVTPDTLRDLPSRPPGIDPSAIEIMLHQLSNTLGATLFRLAACDSVQGRPFRPTRDYEEVVQHVGTGLFASFDLPELPWRRSGDLIPKGSNLRGQDIPFRIAEIEAKIRMLVLEERTAVRRDFLARSLAAEVFWFHAREQPHVGCNAAMALVMSIWARLILGLTLPKVEVEHYRSLFTLVQTSSLETFQRQYQQTWDQTRQGKHPGKRSRGIDPRKMQDLDQRKN